MNKPLYNQAAARMQFRRANSYFENQIRASREQLVFNRAMSNEKRTWPADLYKLGGST